MLTLKNDYRQFLGALVILMQSKVIVEIGVCRGYTTRYLCEAAMLTNGKVYGFDIWAQHGLLGQYSQRQDNGETEEEVRKYLNKLGYDNFTLTTIDTINDQQKTETILNELLSEDKIDLGFIDACHSYVGIKNDFEIVYPRLAEHGIIAFHDT